MNTPCPGSSDFRHRILTLPSQRSQLTAPTDETWPTPPAVKVICMVAPPTEGWFRPALHCGNQLATGATRSPFLIYRFAPLLFYFNAFPNGLPARANPSRDTRTVSKDVPSILLGPFDLLVLVGPCSSSFP
ncbi:hypothetical protein CRG98_007798 [Punica granatum]|uniref:Uncharacterized protein n=1 Tax=Punica granatum TaxID=22663 RepID=A0A2I0KTK0_PUNGR|nr:hypothetical protein CRG98_007798 [Punica granatum]